MNIEFDNLWEDFETSNGASFVININGVVILGFGISLDGLGLALFGFSLEIYWN